MNKCSGFLEYAETKFGIEVGFGKMFLVYKEKVSKSVSDLTAEAIQADIESGEIIGIIQGWHTIAGAPVAEINVERTGTAEMKLIRPEISADTLTFGGSIVSSEILGDLVKAGSLDCILIDDQGNCFGDYSQTAGEISSMVCNFSGKTSGSLQRDNVTEKTVAITVRYLVRDLNVLEAGTETELINSKTLLTGQLSSVTSISATEATFVMKITDKSTGRPYDGTISDASVKVIGLNAEIATSTYVPLTGMLTVELSGAALAITEPNVNVSISDADCYMKETVMRLGE